MEKTLKLKSKEKKEETIFVWFYRLNYKGIKIIGAFFLLSQCGLRETTTCGKYVVSMTQENNWYKKAYKDRELSGKDHERVLKYIETTIINDGKD